MRPRKMRRRSVKEPRIAARDGLRTDSATASRLERAERTGLESAKAIDALTKRMDQLESQLDYIASKIRPA